MKKPILTQHERALLKQETLIGGKLRLKIAWLKFLRELNKT